MGEGDVGACFPAVPTSAGDPCEIGRVVADDDPRKDRVASAASLDCPKLGSCFSNYGGFPDGMRNASTDPSDAITAGADFVNLSGDVNPADGIPDGSQHWNNLLNNLIGAGLLPPTPPRERQILHTNALGTEVWVDVLTYDPGLIGGAASAPLGYASTFILENANPTNPPSPSLITDTCGLFNAYSESGNDFDRELGSQCNNATDDDGDGFVNDGCPQVGGISEAGAECNNAIDDDLGDTFENHFANGGIGFVNDGCPPQGTGAVHRTNPTSPGTKPFALNSTSSRDADQGPSAPSEPTVFPFPPAGPAKGTLDGDGLVNNLDTCPFTPNFGSPLSPAGVPFSGDQEVTPEFTDGLDSACDPRPTLFDGSDADGDFYANRGDNCPLVPNGIAPGPNPTNQRDVGEFLAGTPVDGGPASDSIGDDCDLNPTVADGHFHTKLNLAPVCITAGPFADGDGDGWCDVEEVALGGSTAGTPESLQVPGSCSDGVDNDADGNTDLNDTGCQLPMHDLSIKKVNGGTTVCNPSNTVDYVVILSNDQATDENGEISIYLDSQPSYVPAPGPSPAPGKSAGSVTSVSGATVTASGPINIDGDADVEWLTKATVSVKGAPASTTVHFNVTYPACGGGPNATAVDYTVNVDLCHGNDVAPLGVSPLFGNCAGGPSDGGQDRNSANDGIVTRNVDDVTK